MTAAARPPRDGLSIGAVLAQLRPDFPDVTISKIRFLESEGLISPARTGSGYRQFTAVDVARLRFVLAAQRDHYLPLKVIREQLAAADTAAVEDSRRAAAARPLTAVPALPVPPDTFDEPVDDRRLSRDDVVAGAGIDTVLFAELEQYGLIRADPAGTYDAAAVVVATTARAMTEFGIEPRHLRAFRASADREVGLLAQIVAPLDRNPDPATRARAEEMRRELAALSVTLHTLLVKAGLRALAGG
ncbi:MAG TPA: MerR family transcriptional regulator [Pseudonocardiaceae bacterium]|nr:MerR family transcriptional regulator [Pseudonocardiaceae bacterium]